MNDYRTLRWPTTDEFQIHKAMFKAGGYMTVGGLKYGEGEWFHFRGMVKALWPKFDWHEWSELLLKTFVENKEIGIMGPGSSGKTFCSAAFALTMFYCWPEGTSIIMSSTTRQGLQLRIWGAIKELNKEAKKRRSWLPGKVVESSYMLINEGDDEDMKVGNDHRDGIIGVAAKVGGQFVGISNYVGLKNARVILIADEASLMERGFLDSVSNLRKNPVFKLIAMGNPKDRTDALGTVCEPHPSIGGWDGVGAEEKTRTWKTRVDGGIAVQLCGWDTPNAKYPKGVNPYRGIITPEQIQNDLDYYGRDSLQFSMMNLGIMPRDGGSRRIITMSLCEQNGAFEEPVWASSEKITHVLGLDAAYSGVGGDRCVLIHLAFGPDVSGKQILAFMEAPIIVPVTALKDHQAEEQIATFVRMYAEKAGIDPSRVGLDSTGRGTLMSALARLWSPAVVPVEFGGKPTDRPVRPGDPKTEAEAYGKNVTALWYASRLVVEGRQMRKLPREVAEEGCMREWGINRQSKIDVEPKDKTKERLGRSPDLWDALVVAIEIARKNGFQIASGNRVGIVKRKTPSWLTRADSKMRRLRKEHQLSYA